VVTNPRLEDSEARKTLLLLPKLAMQAPGRFVQSAHAGGGGGGGGGKSMLFAADASAMRELRRQNKILRKEKKILLSQRKELILLAKRRHTEEVTEAAEAVEVQSSAQWQVVLAQEAREFELRGTITKLQEEVRARLFPFSPVPTLPRPALLILVCFTSPSILAFPQPCAYHDILSTLLSLRRSPTRRTALATDRVSKHLAEGRAEKQTQ
jgi:hypothetical protein